MTQEDKDLVLKDMCSRVPYGLRLWIKMYERKPDYFIKSHNILSSVNYTTLSPRISIEGALYDIEGPEYSCGEQYIKPYLRPMSSMTEDEYNEFKGLIPFCKWCDDYDKWGHYGIEVVSYEYDETDKPYYDFVDFQKLLDWLNAHHFDYRGLIPKGLALEAPEGIYNN